MIQDLILTEGEKALMLLWRSAKNGNEDAVNELEKKLATPLA